MHCISIDINKFINSYLSQHLRGSDLAYITKLFLNAPCVADKGHNLDAPYVFPLNYTAKILGRGRESTRRVQENLHALGLITVDGESWQEYQDNKNRRKKTGMVQEVRFSDDLKRTIKKYLSKEKIIEWIFEAPKAFLKKCSERLTRAKEAKSKFLSKDHAKEKEVRPLTNKEKKKFKDFLLSETQPDKVQRGVEYLIKHLIQKGFAKDQKEGLGLIQDIYHFKDP